MGTKLAICNRKGGVGKTVSTFYIGRWLARSGQSVTMYDLDPQRGLWDIASLLGRPDGKLFPRLKLEERNGHEPATNWVLFDTPPALDGSLPALREADYLIIPVIPEAQETSQLGKFLTMLDETHTDRPFTRILGILPVRYVHRWAANRAMLEHIRALAAEFGIPTFEPVPMSNAVSSYSLRGGLWRHVANRLMAL